MRRQYKGMALANIEIPLYQIMHMTECDVYLNSTTKAVSMLSLGELDLHKKYQIIGKSIIYVLFTESVNILQQIYFKVLICWRHVFTWFDHLVLLSLC